MLVFVVAFQSLLIGKLIQTRRAQVWLAKLFRVIYGLPSPLIPVIAGRDETKILVFRRIRIVEQPILQPHRYI